MHAHRRPAWVSRVLLGAVAIATALGGVLLWISTGDDHATALPIATNQAPTGLATSAGPKLVRSQRTGPGPAGQLLIPSIDVAAPLVWTTITAGRFDVPADVSSVGIWNNGAHPGDAHGAIVAAGHVSDNSDRPGALHDLGTVRPGAQLELVDAAGRAVTYQISSVREYGQDQLPQDLTASDSNVLRLVSCARRVTTDGGRAFHYTDNLVITATPQGEPS